MRAKAILKLGSWARRATAPRASLCCWPQPGWPGAGCTPRGVVLGVFGGRCPSCSDGGESPWPMATVPGQSLSSWHRPGAGFQVCPGTSAMVLRGSPSPSGSVELLLGLGTSWALVMTLQRGHVTARASGGAPRQLVSTHRHGPGPWGPGQTARPRGHPAGPHTAGKGSAGTVLLEGPPICQPTGAQCPPLVQQLRVRVHRLGSPGTSGRQPPCRLGCVRVPSPGPFSERMPCTLWGSGQRGPAGLWECGLRPKGLCVRGGR